MKTYFAYIRVSTAKQGKEGSSLTEQRGAIEAFAKQRNFVISEWYEEQQTAAKKGRSEFLRMMQRLERRAASGVLLHKIDRGARNLWDWARIQNLLDAGIEVHFAHDNLDMKSRGGRLAADIQAVVAADYVRNLREEILKGQLGRLKEGLLPRAAPLGYLNNGKRKPKTIDPVKGPLVRLAFKLYASRQHSFHTLRAELHRHGLTRKDGGPLSLCSITAILRNPFYTGVIRQRSTGEHFTGMHEPLIPVGMFREVQNVLDGKLTIRSNKNDFLYRRLFTCGLCHASLIGERQKGIVYYRCHTPSCPTTGIREDGISAQLGYLVDSIRLSAEDVEELEPLIDEEERASIKGAAERLQAANMNISTLEEREVRLTDAYVDQLIDRDAYQKRKAALLLELTEARSLRQRSMIDNNAIGLRIKRYFELMQTIGLDQAKQRAPIFREAVRIVTSNRTLVGKNPYLTLQSPFQELASGLVFLRSAPARGTTRTFSTLQRASPDSKRHYRHLLRLLKKYLKDWEPPTQLTIPEPLKGKPRHQFRPRHDNDELRDTA